MKTKTPGAFPFSLGAETACSVSWSLGHWLSFILDAAGHFLRKQLEMEIRTRAWDPPLWKRRDV